MAYDNTHALAQLALEDRIDVQDEIIDRIEELEGEETLEEGEAAELKALIELRDELEGMGGDVKHNGLWYPQYLIHDNDFENYAEELAEDCGMVDPSAKWPMNCIDWEKAAKELKWDYSSVEIAGFTFWCR